MVTVITNAIRTVLWNGIPVSCEISNRGELPIIKCETVNSKAAGSGKNFLYRHRQPAYRHPFKIY